MIFKGTKYIYRSAEELHFSYYLDELKQSGFVEDYEYETTIFELSPLVKESYEISKTNKKGEVKIITKCKTILRPHIYTLDFKISFKKVPLFLKETVKDNIWFVEIKPDYNYQNMLREFKINQKWVYDKYKIFIDIVVPKQLFMKTFTPEKYLFTEIKKQPRKISWEIKKLQKDGTIR